MIDEGEAGGELKEAYRTMRRQRGKIANIMKVHSLNPGAMKAHMNLYMTIMFADDGLAREE